MNTPIHSDLLKEINDFLDRQKMSRTTFGTQAVKDPNFVSDLEEGRECRRKTLALVRGYMAERSAA